MINVLIAPVNDLDHPSSRNVIYQSEDRQSTSTNYSIATHLNARLSMFTPLVQGNESRILEGANLPAHKLRVAIIADAREHGQNA